MSRPRLLIGGDPIWGCDRSGIKSQGYREFRSWLFQLSQFLQIHQRIVMSISVISVSSDLSEDSVGTRAGRVILFGTFPITIPDTTSVITPPTTQTDTIDIDTPDTPPSPTHGTPFTKTTLSTQRSPTASGALRRRVIFLDDSSSSSSSETSSDSSADALSDSASSRSSSGHSLSASPSGTRSSHRLCSLVPSVYRSSAISERPSHDSSSVSLSHKRSRSPVASVPLSLPTLGALSYARADLLPSPKRIRSPETATDLEGCSEDSFEPYVPRKVGLGVNFEDENSEPSRSRGADLEMDVDVVRSDGIYIDPEILAEIDECFSYADALRARRIDARVVVEAIDREEIETGVIGPVEGAVEVTYETLGDLVQRFHDHTEEILVYHIHAIESVQGDQGHQIVAIGHQSADMLEMIQELERDNRRLRDIVDVESLRLVPGGILVTVLRLFRDYPSIDSTMPNTRSRASRTREGVNEQSDRRMAKALRVRDAVRNLRPLMGNKVNGNGGNGNRGNGNGGNGNGNRNGEQYSYNFRGVMPTRECTYQDFLKCQPLNFNGTEGTVGLTRWFEKMETIFHISNRPEKYQVKYASCMLLNSALTWWNSH
ncbi:hypothetical protein Tco_1184053 [Tanacetum coccineum]